VNANGINECMAIVGFGALHYAKSAPALPCQELHCIWFIEALLHAIEKILCNFERLPLVHS
jgi:hypothetical protein